VRRLLAPLAVGVLPIVVAVVRALTRDWLPMGDNAYFTIRARDVLTEHHPLVGAWSSGSEALGVDVNNLGPLQLDLLAAPVRAFGIGPGTAVGVAAVNLAAVGLVIVLLHRRLGSLGAWLGAALAAGLTWTLGSELLFEPRQHHALVLPFAAFLVAAWAVAAGDRWALPAALAVGSLVAQTHFTFVLPTLLVGVAAVVGGALGRDGRSWRAPLLVSVLVVVAAWVQPVVEELGGDDGNLSAVVDAARADTGAYGAGGAVRVTAEVLAPPAGWWRGSFRGFDPAAPGLSTGAAAAVLALVLGSLAAVGGLAHRREDRPIVVWMGVAAVAIGGALVAAASAPVAEPFGPVSGNFRYLWPIAAFTTVGLAAGLLRALPERWASPAVAVVAVTASGLALLALPTSYQSPRPEIDAPLIPVAHQLVDQLAAADLAEPVAIDRRGLYFGEPFSYVAVAALQQAGVELVFDAPTDLARFGDSRARTGPVAGTVSFTSGDAARADRVGYTLLARGSLLDEQEWAELASLRAATALDDDQRTRFEELADLAERGTVAVWFTPAT
jgi:hypothetical protein